MLSPTLASLAIFGIAILPSLSYAIDVALPPLPVLAQPLTGANGHVVGKAHLSKTDLRHLVAGRQVSAQDLREKRAFGKVKRHQGNGPQAPVAPAPSTASCASAKYDRSGQCCPTQRSHDAYTREGCCASNEVLANFVGNNYCCSATSASTILGALNNIPHRRRSVAADMGRDVETPLPPLTYATGHRTLLNAELAAKYLLGGGRFEHNGLEYDDTRLGGSIRKAAPASTGQSWLGGYIRETLGNAIPLSGPLASVMVPKLFADPNGEFALSSSYKIRTADLPFIANRIYNMDPDFDALYLRSLRLDRNMVEQLHKYFPAEHRQRFETYANHLQVQRRSGNETSL
ncbi:hypothetical protein EMMF5_000267 [Cystobasidiomycetes sp. EMM_F5]